MARIITFGEIMLRLMPQDGHRFLQNEWLEATYGGGEANVAVSLANYGEKAAFVTALPDNDIAQACINSLRYFGVDTEKILRQGDRIGVYYVEKGQSQRPSKVIYDRKGSSIASAHRDDFHWDEIFDCVEWFHWTGITPALSDSLKEICMDACQEAKKRGITISCDLNYRKNLWTEAEAYNTMTKLVPYVDLCIANEEDAEKVLGIKAKNSDVNSGKLDREGYKDVAAEISRKYGCKKVAITLRESVSANDNRWSGMLYDGESCYFSKTYDIRLWDRVGGGDSFGGGLIYSLINGKDSQYAIDFAAAASCLKQTIQGDFNRVTVKEVENLMRGGGSGRVLR